MYHIRPIEFYKPIENYNGYFISDEGNVYCNLGKGNRKNGKTVELYRLKPRPTKNGYLRVYMRNTETDKREDKYIHRLVGEAFVPNDNPEVKTQINHKNFIRSKNHAENLEWVSPKENTQYTIDSNHVYRSDEGKFVSNFNYTEFANNEIV